MKKRKPWNKNKIVGSKPALSFNQVQTIKTVLAQKDCLRDQLLFSLAIDSSLRWVDLIKLRVEDVMLMERVRDKIRIIPSKTRNSSWSAVVFEPTASTIELIEKLVIEEYKSPNDFLFVRRDRAHNRVKIKNHVSVLGYARLVKKWISYAGLEPKLYGTHSLRRTRPAHIYAQTWNLRACQLMLGHSSINTTQVYLWIEEQETLDIARRFQM